MKRIFAPEPEAQRVAGWVVSFGDMITNLMACFVLMQSFATTQDKTLFNAGMGSYRRAIEQYGLPDWLFGKEDGPKFDYRKIKYPTPSDDTKDDADRSRIIDLQEDQIRLAFAKVSKAMETKGQRAEDEVSVLRRLDIKYPAGGVELDAAARASLNQVTAELRQGLAGRRTRLCVIGVVAGGGERERWILSARRAESAKDHLRRELEADIRSGNLELVSWGAGQGKDWCTRVGMDRPADKIILAITKIGENRG